MRNLVALICGLGFGCGLVLSGMTDRFKVLAFLDLFGAWDPSLMGVMASALLVSIPSFFWARQIKHPILASEFFLPKKSNLDAKLIVGAVLFGLGWGLYGLCPGPAIASLTYGQLHTLAFTLAMIVGLGLAKWVGSRSA